MKHFAATQAIKTAKKSHYPHFRHGAVIECGGRIFTKNPNIRKSRTPDASMSVHAEVAALKPLLSKTRLSANKPQMDLYVARVSPSEKLALSKPCDKCMKALRDSGVIRAVYYTTDGGWAELTIC